MVRRTVQTLGEPTDRQARIAEVLGNQQSSMSDHRITDRGLWAQSFQHIIEQRQVGQQQGLDQRMITGPPCTNGSDGLVEESGQARTGSRRHATTTTDARPLRPGSTREMESDPVILELKDEVPERTHLNIGMFHVSDPTRHHHHLSGAIALAAGDQFHLTRARYLEENLDTGMQMRNRCRPERPHHREQMGHAATDPESIPQVPHGDAQGGEQAIRTVGGRPGVDGNGIGFIQVSPTLCRKVGLQ